MLSVKCGESMNFNWPCHPYEGNQIATVTDINGGNLSQWWQRGLGNYRMPVTGRERHRAKSAIRGQVGLVFGVDTVFIMFGVDTVQCL